MKMNSHLLVLGSGENLHRYRRIQLIIELAKGADQLSFVQNFHGSIEDCEWHSILPCKISLIPSLSPSLPLPLFLTFMSIVTPENVYTVVLSTA